MAMGKKKRRQQEDLWVATSELPRTAGHPFCERLHGLFNEHGFDDFVGGDCVRSFYADKMGATEPWLRECTFGCCWWGISKGSDRNEELPGEPAISLGTARVSGIESERIAV